VKKTTQEQRIIEHKLTMMMQIYPLKSCKAGTAKLLFNSVNTDLEKKE